VLATFLVLKQLYGTAKSLTDNFRSLRFSHFRDITSQKYERYHLHRDGSLKSRSFKGFSLSASSFVSISVVHTTPHIDFTSDW